jgi:hypothetical protein
VFAPDGGTNDLFNVMTTDAVLPGGQNRILAALPPGAAPPAVRPTELTTDDVNLLLQRAAAASASSDGIFVVVDRNGQILGVRAESGVDPNITGNMQNLVFAVDGAYAKALTAAYFANDQAPLTSRTIQTLSESTITEREVNSNPSVTDPTSPSAAPGSWPTWASRRGSRGASRTPRRWTCSRSSTPTATSRSRSAATGSRGRPTTWPGRSGST